MCGIVGYIGRREAVPVLLEGLRSLEYRGYDSAGLAVVHRNRLQVTKTAGRVQDLRDRVSDRTRATIGIGHTRWATHGEPNEVNAHPHTDAEGRMRTPSSSGTRSRPGVSSLSATQTPRRLPT